MNLLGANIKYPYHELPMKSTADRLGYWALMGILDLIQEEMPNTPPIPKGKSGTRFTIDCGKPPKDRK